jgi:PhzF family phenazine biosynthesis protein
MQLKINVVDAFTEVPFKGNPAAVCILDSYPDDELLQKVAFEMNLSETAYAVRTDTGYELRWFTPASEVDLCGHATLATSHLLWESAVVKKNEAIKFSTKSGELTCKYLDGTIEMDFPLIEESEVDHPPALERAIGAEPLYVGMTQWNYVVELASDEIVRKMKPDFELLQTLPGWGTIVTAKSSDPAYDFISRFFAPEKGVKEDPVTGSAHCALGPFWQKRLGKSEFTAYQASERGGVLGVKVQNDRVILKGKAVTVLNGIIKI